MKLVTRGVKPALIPLFILLLGLFLLPILYSIKPTVNYELVKVSFFRIWVEIFVLSVILFNFERINPKKIFTKINCVLFAFFGIAFFSSYIGVDYSRSFWGNSFRGDGLLTLSHGVLLFVFVQLAWRDSWKKYLTYTLIGASILVSVYALGHGKNSGTLGHTAFLGGYLLLTLPFFFNAQNKFKALIILPILAIIFSQSRFAMLGALLVPITWLKSLRANVIHIPGGQLFLAYSVFSILYFSVFAFSALTITDDYKVGNTIVYEDRLRIYTKGFLGFLDRPLLGYGYANFDKAFEKIDWPAKVENDVYVDKAHSIWLEILVTTGLIGFIFHISFVKLICNRLRWDNPFSKTVTIALVLYLINSQVNVTSISQDALFWTFAGVLANFSSRS